MCFYTNHSLPKIAQKNIVCYKILNRRWSPHVPFYYEKNKINEKVALIVVYSNQIYQGYHSYKTFWQYIPKYDDYASVPKSKFRIYKMIIPKGSVYYENYQEYVSETIILKRKAFFYSF